MDDQNLCELCDTAINGIELDELEKINEFVVNFNGNLRKFKE